MLISKFDLYKTEWLDLVFDDRNKDYGAYELRQHYARNMLRAMGITFFSVAVLCVASIVFKPVPSTERMIPVVNQPDVILPPIKEIKKPEQPLPSRPVKVEPPAQPVTTIMNVPPVVVQDNKAKDLVKNDDLDHAVISTVDAKGTTTGQNVLPVDPTPPGNGTTTAPDDKVYPSYGLEFLPEPIGGEKAWSKFLNRNLRYPSEAQDLGLSGRVFLSFIIEKDGHLSNITVDKGAGHGFDEEALRVLKLAKAWKPGMQNGQAVRVKYSIPINFQAATE